MDFRVVWSPEAIEDVEAIAEYIAKDSQHYARAVVLKLLEAARDIRDYPKAGRVVPELADDAVRERFVYSYRLIYEVRERDVLIVAVIHGKRQLDGMARGQ